MTLQAGQTVLAAAVMASHKQSCFKLPADVYGASKLQQPAFTTRVSNLISMMDRALDESNNHFDNFTMTSKRYFVVETIWEDPDTGLVTREQRMQELLADKVDVTGDRESIDPILNILDTGKSRRRGRKRGSRHSGVDEMGDSESVERKWAEFCQGKTQGEKRTQKPLSDKIEEMPDQEPTDMNGHRGTGKTKGKSPVQKVPLDETDEMRNRQTGGFDKPGSPTYSAVRYAHGGPHATSQQPPPSVTCSNHGKTGRNPVVVQNAVTSSPSNSRHGGISVMDPFRP
jgi:hypothetical protein